MEVVDAESPTVFFFGGGGGGTNGIWAKVSMMNGGC